MCLPLSNTNAFCQHPLLHSTHAYFHFYDFFKERFNSLKKKHQKPQPHCKYVLFSSFPQRQSHFLSGNQIIYIFRKHTEYKSITLYQVLRHITSPTFLHFKMKSTVEPMQGASVVEQACFAFRVLDGIKRLEEDRNRLRWT